VGRRIRSVYDENLPRTVIGVIPDVQLRGVSRNERQPMVLVPRAQSVRRSMGFLVRTAGDPSALVPAVRRTMSELDPDVALDGLGALRDAHAADLAGIRFLTTLFGTFGLLALILAVGGVYGLVSHSVERRRQEIGVRMAMGASTGIVRRSVLGESALMAGVGLAIGLVLAYGAGRVLAAAMSGVAVLEVSTFVGVVAVLAAAVLTATWFPAVRATRVDPVEALRSE
jgi:putative ABC transport system permease protein